MSFITLAAALAALAILGSAVAAEDLPEARKGGAAVVSVSTQDELDAAARELRGGETLLLSGGTYAALELDAAETRARFAEPVTIASADPDDPAVVRRMLLRGVSNVEIRDVTFDRAPDETERAPFVIDGARGITLDGVVFEGHVSEGFGVGVGLLVLGSRDVSLIGSELSDLRNGLRVADAEGLTIRGNDFRGMSNDSMILGGVEGVVIEENRFRDQKSPPDLKHKDSIQFHTENGPSRDIAIRRNRIENPEVSHSIFFGNGTARDGDLDAYYRNVVIEDNFIRGAHAHGVTIEHGMNVRIENNVILQNPDLGHVRNVNVPIINVSSLSRDVTIRGNRVASVPEPQDASWDVTGNEILRGSLKHWYGDYPRSGAESAAGGRPEDAAARAPRLRERGSEDAPAD